MRKGNRQLNFMDRQTIEKMYATGVKVLAIADKVGVHRTTIYNELKRGGEPYRAEAAQKAL